MHQSTANSLQKIRSTAYTSFSVFWLLFILVAGLIIILISATIESIALSVKTWLPRSNGYARLEWRASHALHLQRLAHEELGTRDWVQGAWDIPILAEDVKLAAMREDKRLPRFITCAEEE